MMARLLVMDHYGVEVGKNNSAGVATEEEAEGDEDE